MLVTLSLHFPETACCNSGHSLCTRLTGSQNDASFRSHRTNHLLLTPELRVVQQPPWLKWFPDVRTTLIELPVLLWGFCYLQNRLVLKSRFNVHVKIWSSSWRPQRNSGFQICDDSCRSTQKPGSIFFLLLFNPFWSLMHHRQSKFALPTCTQQRNPLHHCTTAMSLKSTGKRHSGTSN